MLRLHRYKKGQPAPGLFFAHVKLGVVAAHLGENDEAIPHIEADQLAGWGDSDKTELIKIPGAGHTFGAAHPWVGMPDELETVLDHTASFFDKHL